MEYKQEIAKLLSSQLPDIQWEEIVTAIETPPTAEMGHFGYPCFRLAKAMRKAPPAIATELAQKLSEGNTPDWLERVESASAYVNFYLDKPSFGNRVLEIIQEKGNDYGKGTIGAGKVVLAEYSSPNVAKHFHVGHLGTTLIGHALRNIYSDLGYKTISVNYLGDWGTAFGKLLTAYLRWGDRQHVEKTGLDGLTELYVRFHDEADNDPSLNDEARSQVVKMESGDEEILEIWQWICDISLRDYSKTYERLGMSFDSYRGESYYRDKMTPVVDELREKGLLSESEGAQIVDLEEYKMPPSLIIRRDGGTLYATRDMAAAIDRYNNYHFDKCLYVTGSEQKLHFAQFFKVLELMGYEWAKNMTHIYYGFFRLEEGAMSTRRGQVIKMVDLLNESVAKTLEIINEKSPNLENKDEVAEQVGIGAVIFNVMYNNRIKDVMFSWERMLNFEGETGPYVQYTHARACSLLEKAGIDTSGDDGKFYEFAYEFDAAHLVESDAFEVLRLLYIFPDRIEEAADKYEPFIISRYLVALAQAFNKFYNTQQILTGDSAQNSRLALVSAICIVLKRGLGLLGISAPKKM